MVKCLKCGKILNENSSLGSHLRIHKTNLKDYQKEFNIITTHKCKMCNNEIPFHRIYCSNKCKFSDKDYTLTKVLPPKNDKTKALRCKLDGYITSDINNKSGHATRYLRNNHDIDTKDYMQYYEIISNPKLSIKLFHCPIEGCEWTTADLTNSSGWFTTHLKKVHNSTPEEFCNSKPEYKIMWQQYFKHLDYKNFIEEDEKNRIQCLECGKWFKKVSNTHLQNKHKITVDDYKKKYEVYNTASNVTSDIQSEITSEYNIRNGTMAPHKNSSYEQNFEKNLIKSNILYITPFLYKGKNYDFYLPELNLIIEIDGIAFHPDRSINLTIQTMRNTINDYSKDIIIQNTKFNIKRLRYIQEEFDSVDALLQLIKNIEYIRNYEIENDQIISNSEYFMKYIEYKGCNKLQQYVPMILKFIRLFYPTNQFIYSNKILNLWNNDDIMYKVIKELVGLENKDALNFTMQNVINILKRKSNE